MISSVTNENVFHLRGGRNDKMPVNKVEGADIDHDNYFVSEVYIGNGSEFLNFDTCDVFIFDEALNEWKRL